MRNKVSNLEKLLHVLTPKEFENYLYNFDKENPRASLLDWLEPREIQSIESNLIYNAFTWANTPEGPDYWRKINDRFLKDWQTDKPNSNYKTDAETIKTLERLLDGQNKNPLTMSIVLTPDGDKKQIGVQLSVNNELSPDDICAFCFHLNKATGVLMGKYLAGFQDDSCVEELSSAAKEKYSNFVNPSDN